LGDERFRPRCRPVPAVRARFFNPPAADMLHPHGLPVGWDSGRALVGYVSSRTKQLGLSKHRASRRLISNGIVTRLPKGRTDTLLRNCDGHAGESHSHGAKLFFWSAPFAPSSIHKATEKKTSERRILAICSAAIQEHWIEND
jgi:hypothetical protein